MRRDNQMLETILLAWIAIAIFTAWGFHLTRRHWEHIQEEEAMWRHPVWRTDRHEDDEK